MKKPGQIYRELRARLTLRRMWKSKFLKIILILNLVMLTYAGATAAWAVASIPAQKPFEPIEFHDFMQLVKKAQVSSICVKYFDGDTEAGRYAGNEVVIYIATKNEKAFATSRLEFMRLSYTDFTDAVKEGKIRELIKFYDTENYALGLFEEERFFVARISFSVSPDKLLELLTANKVQWWELTVQNISVSNFSERWGEMIWLAPKLLVFLGMVAFINWREEKKEIKNAYNKLSIGQKVTMKDVGGIDEAKQEITEILEMIAHPEKFDRVGAKRPRGILLFSPPGCGKTLLARAIAGEADVPFMPVTASEFIEKYVGTGASRIRDVFSKARNTARQTGKTVILFIDELDAIGTRASDETGGDKEYSQTITQLLTEMDGFQPNENVFVIGATNRPDKVDPAVRRPGRFDRQVNIPLPDLRGRQLILGIHCKKKPIDPTVDMAQVAKRTPVGFSGADLANVANEAAILAALDNRETIIMLDFTKAIEKVMVGSERKTAVMTPKDNKITAVHEAGHAVVAAFTEEASPPKKVTIIPTTKGAGGYTLMTDKEDRFYWTKMELLAKITALFGGRAAEELIFGEAEISTGAQQDFIEATKIAEQMVYDLGMATEYLGYRTLRTSENQYLGGGARMKAISDVTATIADKSIQKILEHCYKSAVMVLKQYRTTHDALTKALLEKETLEEEDLGQILKQPQSAEANQSPFESN